MLTKQVKIVGVRLTLKNFVDFLKKERNKERKKERKTFYKKKVFGEKHDRKWPNKSQKLVNQNLSFTLSRLELFRNCKTMFFSENCL